MKRSTSLSIVALCGALVALASCDDKKSVDEYGCSTAANATCDGSHVAVVPGNVGSGVILNNNAAIIAGSRGGFGGVGVGADVGGSSTGTSVSRGGFGGGASGHAGGGE